MDRQLTATLITVAALTLTLTRCHTGGGWTHKGGPLPAHTSTGAEPETARGACTRT